MFTGGSRGDDDRLAAGVETALTRKDEHGRVLPPKEAFRQLCYRWVGGWVGGWVLRAL